MISKRIDRKAGAKDSIRDLGNYIRDASHEGEKTLFSWQAGCESEMYDEAIIEIEATQAMNTRTEKTKTYHLMVSFRPEDEARLTPAMFREIEKSFAEALGFEEHGRLCGVHKNTNNMHMHIAYNMIHPERFTRHEPFRDFSKRTRVCQELEKKLGLVVDVTEKEAGNKQIDQRAASMEAHSGEQSFQSYALGRKQHIFESIEKAQSWRDAHEVFAIYGMKIKLRGNGMVIAPMKGKGSIKASDLDRGLSKAKLEARFGKYEAGNLDELAKLAKETYQKNPLHSRSPEQEQLYKDYQHIQEQRQLQIQQEQERAAQAQSELQKQWERIGAELDKKILSSRGRSAQLRLLRPRHQQAMAQARAEHQERLRAIKNDLPFHNWNGFLKWQANQGNETALKVLRSKKDAPGQEPERKNLTEYHAAIDQAKMRALAQEQKIQASSNLAKRRRGLLAVNRMALLATQEKLRIEAGVGDSQPMFSGYKQNLDNKGVVIFTLQSGGTIRDTGEKLYYTPNEATRKAAMLYAQSKFGKGIELTESTIERKKYHGNRNRFTKPHPDILKDSARNGVRPLSQLDVVSGKKRPAVLLQGHARDDLER